MDSKNLKDVLDKYGKYVIQQAKSNLTKDVNKFGSKAIDHVPTCGVVAIQFNTKHWKNIKDGKTLFTEFPRYYK